MSKKQSNKFNFFVPATFQKGTGADGLPAILEIEGVASYEVEDVDEETLEPLGFDYRPFLEKGFLNWNHQANKTASAIIGEPTEAKVIDQGKAFWIKGFLYRDDLEAQAVYKKGLILEKNSKTRRLGFSIEGQATERDPLNPKRIKKARITGCAITASPKNPNTLMSIVKGEYETPFVEDDEVEKGQTCPKCDHDQMFDGKCLECGHVEKSITAANTNILSVESVEGVKNTNARGTSKVAQALKKSEIYNHILNTYTKDATIAKGIYDYILLANKKINNMASGEITPDVLKKALSFLDSALIKSEEGNEPNEEEEEDDNEENEAVNEEPTDKEPVEKAENAVASNEDEQATFDKAMGMARECLKKGFNKGQTLDEMVKAGFKASVAEGACSKCIAEASSQKDGGTVSQHNPTGFDKSITDSLALLLATQDNLIKSFDASNINIDNKFKAVGVVLNASLTGNEILQKSITELTTRLEKIESTPVGAKSITNIQAVERFSKGEEVADNNTYSLSKSDDVRALINRLGAVCEAKRAAGRQNTILEKAVANLEITKSLGSERDMIMIHPEFQALNIKVVR